jgi:hypothetical protein
LCKDLQILKEFAKKVRMQALGDAQHALNKRLGEKGWLGMGESVFAALLKDDNNEAESNQIIHANNRRSRRAHLRRPVTQNHLTEDTVDAQFCSDWLKGEIKLLFKEISRLEQNF